MRASLRKWHCWLGWLIGIPTLLWTISGVVMVARPISEVRGTDLLREPAAITLSGSMPTVPNLGGLKVRSLRLERRADGPRWVIETADGSTRLADAATGQLLPALSAAQALREVEALYQGKARLVSVSRTEADSPPIELRRPIDTWKVVADDGAHFFVDRSTGAVVARRTRFWRIYDFFWGLHIMDLQGRENPHNPWLIGFGAVSVLAVLIALALLPMTIRRRRPR